MTAHYFIIRYFLLPLGIAGVLMFAPSGSAVDPAHVRKVWLTGTEERKTFEARAKDRKFTTLASLEDYLATIPAGEQVKFHFDDGGVFAETATGPQINKYRDALKEFCVAHQLGFSWGVYML